MNVLEVSSGGANTETGVVLHDYLCQIRFDSNISDRKRAKLELLSRLRRLPDNERIVLAYDLLHAMKGSDDLLQQNYIVNILLDLIIPEIDKELFRIAKEDPEIDPVIRQYIIGRCAGKHISLVNVA